ncbi:MAG: hypothetical protein LR000_02280 [Candidatus Pacebacteria bacterium]|nr:hypothetical protein [Candidatus Paceibacterota bacterium]
MGVIDQKTKEEFKKELERMLSIEAYTRGVVLKTHKDYILRKEGEEGLKKVEKVIKEC